MAPYARTTFRPPIIGRDEAVAFPFRARQQRRRPRSNAPSRYRFACLHKSRSPLSGVLVSMRRSTPASSCALREIRRGLTQCARSSRRRRSGAWNATAPAVPLLCGERAVRRRLVWAFHVENLARGRSARDAWRPVAPTAQLGSGASMSWPSAPASTRECSAVSCRLGRREVCARRLRVGRRIRTRRRGSRRGGSGTRSPADRAARRWPPPCVR
jgi:hypothetical protein